MSVLSREVALVSGAILPNPAIYMQIPISIDSSSVLTNIPSWELLSRTRIFFGGDCYQEQEQELISRTRMNLLKEIGSVFFKIECMMTSL